MRPAQNIIKRPLLTEKSARLRETGGAAKAHAEGEAYKQKLVFEVVADANKVEIRNAIQSLFKVSVTDVKTLVVRGKVKRVGRYRRHLDRRESTTSGQRSSMKKAIVTLKAGDNIEFFEGV